MNKCFVFRNQKNCARLNCKVESVSDYITLILDASEYILTKIGIKDFDEVKEDDVEHRKFNLEDMVFYKNRLYCFVDKKKYFTINFPININSKEICVHYKDSKIELISISHIKGSLPDLIEYFTNPNKHTIEDINNNYDEPLTNNELRFVGQLISSEFGYARYDCDQNEENGKIHPLNHLDFNFYHAKYKIGLYHELTPNEFFYIFGRDEHKQECVFFENKR